MAILKIKNKKPWKSKTVIAAAGFLVLSVVEVAFEVEISSFLYAVMGTLGLVGLRDAISKLDSRDHANQ